MVVLSVALVVIGAVIYFYSKNAVKVQEATTVVNPPASPVSSDTKQEER